MKNREKGKEREKREKKRKRRKTNIRRYRVKKKGIRNNIEKYFI